MNTKANGILFNKLTFNNTGFEVIEIEPFSNKAGSMIKRLSTIFFESDQL